MPARAWEAVDRPRLTRSGSGHLQALHKDYKAKLAGLEEQLATAQRAAERAAAADEVDERAQRIASLEAQLEMAAIERRKAESEAQQAHFRLSNAENDIEHWAAACKRYVPVQGSAGCDA